MNSSAPGEQVRPLVILVVPGFKGTRLVRKGGGRGVWITARHVLPGRTSLALHRPELEISNGSELEAGSLLDRFRILPGIIEFDFYGAWIQRLEEHFGDEASVLPFPYDWRRDNLETVRLLHDRVEDLHDRGARRIWITSHSMGGLVTAYYLRYGKQEPENARENGWGARRVSGVVFAGVPFLGAPQIFHDLQHGSTTGLNRSLLSADALGSFPASYQLLPPPQEPFFHGPDGLPAELPLHEARRWRDHRWGLFREELAPPVVDRRLDFLRKQLGRNVSFMSRLHAPSVAARSAPSPSPTWWATDSARACGRCFEAEPEGEGLDLITLERDLRRVEHLREHTLLDPGDGSVSERSAALPDALEEAHRTMHISSHAEHAELYGDPQVQDELLEFIQR